jgi:acyl-CoA synthetase (AMP-forming)/AMP-acid ligase II
MEIIFAKKLESFGDAVAVIDHDGREYTYRELAALADTFGAEFPKNRKQILLLAADNTLPALTAYLAALRAGVPVIFTPHDKPDTFANIQRQFSPTLTYQRVDGEYQLKHYPEYESKDHDFPEPLAVMISTSGSTGSAKLVKLSAANINANAKSISEYLELTPADRSMTTLPMFYSYGLSVINSYFTTGASLVLNEESVVEEAFWTRFNHYQCTGFAGVPYSYEMLKRSGLEDKSIPSLRYMTVSGGKSAKEMIEYFATLSQNRGWRFFPMYGQTEATSRMTYMPPEQVLAHCGSIGIPIPRGRIELIDEHGQVITGANQPGEIVYYGPNVMMGYAIKREDLYDDAVLTALHSGDIAWRDEGGFYFISGRKSRFLKIFGNRVGLDDLENALRAMGYVTICGGTDKHLIVMTIDQGKKAEIEAALMEKFSLTRQYASVDEVQDFPLLPSGKIDYAKLVRMSEERAQEQEKAVAALGSAKGLTIRDIYTRIFPTGNITPESTFKSLGGDSINFVQMTILLEKKLGNLPAEWQSYTIQQMEALSPAQNTAFLQTIDSSIVLRAFAISEVLAYHSHFKLFGDFNLGGAALLLFLVGYSFARFQYATVLTGKVWSTLAPFMKKLFTPYMATILFFIVLKLIRGKTPDYDMLLVVTNLYRLQVDSLQYVWFFQILIECFVLLGLMFSIQKMRTFLSTDRAKNALILFGLFSAFGLFIDYVVWDTTYLAHNVPHLDIMVIWAGVCVYLAHETAYRWLAAIGGVLVFFLMANHHILFPQEYIWLATGVLVMTFVPTMKVPKLIKPALTEIAAASYYLYFVHVPVLMVISKFVDSPAWSFALLAISCFVLIAGFYQFRNRNQGNAVVE